MPTPVQISCINKDDRFSPYERIRSVGGIHNGKRWRLSLDDAIKGVREGKYRFFTLEGGHRREVLVVERSAGMPFLRTESDYDTPDNLLYLPECP